MRVSVHSFLKEIASDISEIPDDIIQEKKYLFVFLDHLGFSSKVLRAVKDKEWNSLKTDILLLIGESISNMIANVKGSDNTINTMNYKIFSDSICLYWEIGDYENNLNIYNTIKKQELFQQVLYFVAYLQLQASLHDVLFRGGVSVGRFFEYNDAVVSDALVLAHNTESKIGIPVIGFDKSVWGEFSYKYIMNLKNLGYILEYENANFKFDYLDFTSVFVANKVAYTYKTMYFSNLKQCIINNWEWAKKDIKDNNISNVDGIIKKYIWLMNFYNEKCELYSIEEKYRLGKEFFNDLTSWNC